MLFLLPVYALLAGQAVACPQHDSQAHGYGVAKRATSTSDWDYTASYDWHTVNPGYALCRTGTQQSPINLPAKSLAVKHTPTFNYKKTIFGDLFNAGRGPAFNLKSNITDNPSLTFDGETVYLKGWHMHTPAEHTIDGVQSRAELHLVHANADNHERAVVGIRVDIGRTKSAFFQQWVQRLPGLQDKSTVALEVNIAAALAEVDYLKGYWTYQGSLTSPPCTEGLRWFVASKVLSVDNEQMKALLKSSSFSARVLQGLWEQNINV
ncbi:carbonic anhydrase [Bisporella sp. PMI_857]|nr:carbonic anhydrase [Bisporella sp. PMI_857]